MALDKNDLLSLVAANKPDNTTGLITPAKSREVDEQSITSAANLEELTKQVFFGEIEYPNQNIGYSSIGSFVDLTTQTGVLDVPDTVSFGAGGVTDNSEISVSAVGEITVNMTGYYSIKQRFRSGRTGGSGTSLLFFWAEASINGGVTWLPLGNSVDVPLGTANDTVVFFDLSNIQLDSGSMLRNRFARSSTGDDSGDLRSASPSAALTALGVADAPSAQVTFYKIVS
tara:strand:- start:2945 stop:3628 length:684 start_codon:yes stop_codon:yes gene_type:complete